MKICNSGGISSLIVNASILYMSQEKKGGPYTKPEQEKRRMQVYQMYFEKGRSAASIARELEINRNTVNEDIKHFCSEMAKEMQTETAKEFVAKHLERLDMQRERLFKELEFQDIKNKIKIEKMILEINSRETALVTKILDSGYRGFGKWIMNC